MWLLKLQSSNVHVLTWTADSAHCYESSLCQGGSYSTAIRGKLTDSREWRGLHSRVRCDSHASVFGKCASTSACTRECTASASARTRECSASASAITRECTATTRLGGREQRARDSEKRARGRLGGREQRVVSEPDSRCVEGAARVWFRD